MSGADAGASGTLPPRKAGVVRATDLNGVLILKHERLFLLTDPFGDVHLDGRGLGLYEGDTRFLSCYELRINGHRPSILRTGTGAGYKSVLQLTNPDFLRADEDLRDPDVVLRRQSLGITRERILADGFLERIVVENFTTDPEVCRITLRVDADYADIFEVRGLERKARGVPMPPQVEPRRVVLGYRGLDGRVRRTHVAFSEGGERLDEDRPTLGFEHELPPRGKWVLEVILRTETAETDRPMPSASGSHHGPVDAIVSEDAASVAHRAWVTSSASIETTDAMTSRALRRALSDLRLLVNPGPSEGERYVAAGIPWFSCLFGRDSLVTALQLLSVRPGTARETLTLLARLQARDTDPWRDAQPGKILHELRTGELATTGEIPHTPYYGSVDSTPLWLILLSEYYRWTADRDLVDRLWPNALEALRWIDEDGDLDGDGFVEYERRSPRGLVNQGWKDSAEANRYRDGSLAQGPLALVEVQAYVYAARLGMVALARARGEEELARSQEALAEQLRERFEAAFWMDDAGTYALALDRDKRQVDAVASNPGHALWAGIASPERATRVAESLESAELWSGWGVRTLSSATVGYNPIGYHIGTVWPHDNAIIAAGLARYGMREQAAAIAVGLLEATSYFRDSRLPELFCGFDRAGSPYPVPYPVACLPQAWAAGSIFQLVQAMLGMRPDAPARQLELISPSLPAWLPEVRFQNLAVADAVVDLYFHRTDGSTGVQVLRRTGDLSVVVRV